MGQKDILETLANEFDVPVDSGIIDPRELNDLLNAGHIKETASGQTVRYAITDSGLRYLKYEAKIDSGWLPG